MARPSIPVDVIGNTAQLRKQIEELSKTPVILNVQANQRAVSKQAGSVNQLNAGLAAGTAAATSFSRPLGRINGDLTEIDKSLGAANARVIAFGAAAGGIFALQSAVGELFNSFVNTEKQLASINTVLNLDKKDLKSFGKEIFKTAGRTGQSFDTASEAALEFSRQGLGVEETIGRTNDALVLSRLSGLDAASSVNAITAAVNSYRKESLTASTVVNKLANVDAGFAVSSADLAEALSRVGSSASDAGVSFDELIALVTSAQQITARGGSVIGNSLKTIFTRLNRTKTRELFGDLGISTIDEQGQEKNQIALLKDLAGVYNTLGTEQKNYVAEQVGGVFQLNILKAALSDLGRSYSVYDRALNTSLGTTNQADKRNEQLNQTLAGLGNQTLNNIQSAASTVGEGLFAPAAKNVLNIGNFLAESVNTADSSSVGAQLGQGIVNGLGSFLAGPGLAVVGAVLAKLFADFSKYGATAAQSLLGLDSAAKSQASVQQSVAGFLQKNVGLYSSIVSGQTSATSAAKQYLQVINQQTAALQAQSAIVKSVSQAVVANIGTTGRGTSSSSAPAPRRTRFAGFVPNFANMSDRDYYQQVENIGASGHKGGYKAGLLKSVTVHDGMGGKERAYMTSRESKKTWTNSAGLKATMITPPNGFGPNTMVASSGFIPNFARPTPQQFIDTINKNAAKISSPSQSPEAWRAIQSQYPGSVLDKQRNVLVNRNGQIVYNPNIPTEAQWGQYLKGARLSQEEKQLQKSAKIKKGEIINQLGLISNKPEGVSLVYGAEAGPSIKSAQIRYPFGKEYAEVFQGSVLTSGFDRNAMKGSLAQINPKKRIEDAITNLSNDISSQLGLKTKLGTGDIPNVGSVTSAVGTAFEQALINYVGRQVKQAQNKNVDFANPGFIKNIFYNIPGQYEAKENVGGELVQDVIKKYLNNINKAAELEARYSKQKSSAASAGGAAVGAAGRLQKVTSSISRSGVQKYTQDQYKQIYTAESKTGKGQLDADLQAGRIVITDALNSGFVPNFAPNIAAIQKLIKQGATAGERQAAMAAMTRIQAGALSKLGSADKLAKFRELLYGSKSNAGFNLDAIKIKDLRYGPLVAGAKELGLTMKDLEMLSANPAAINQLRALKTNPRSDYFSSGFIPNFASMIMAAQQRALQTERSYGKGAVLDEYRGMQYARQPGQSSNFKTMMKQDHPEGLKAAIKNSATSQGLSRGFVPNFAPQDDFAGNQSASVAAALQSILFPLIFALPQRGEIASQIKEQQKKEIQARQDSARKEKIFQKKEIAERQKQLIREKVIRQKELLNKGFIGKASFDNQRKQLAQNLRAVNNDFKNSTGKINSSFERLSARTDRLINEGKIRPSAGQAVKGFGAGAFGSPGSKIGAAIIAPIIAETIASAVGRETTAGRTTSAAGQGLGFLATGAAIGGAPGAVIGGLVGAGLTYNEYIKASTSNLAKTSRDAEKARAEAARINDLAQTAGSQVSDYFESLAVSGPDSKKTQEAKDNAISTIGKFGSKNAESLTRAFYQGPEAFYKEIDKVSKLAISEDVTKQTINTFEGTASEIRESQQNVFKRIGRAAGYAGYTPTQAQKEELASGLESILFGSLGAKDLIKKVDTLGGIDKLSKPFAKDTEETYEKLREEILNAGVSQSRIDAAGGIAEFAREVSEGAGFSTLSSNGVKKVTESAKKFTSNFGRDLQNFRKTIETSIGKELSSSQWKSVKDSLQNVDVIRDVFSIGVLKPFLEAQETVEAQRRAEEGAPPEEKRQRRIVEAQATAEGYLAKPGDITQVIASGFEKRLDALQKKRAPREYVPPDEARLGKEMEQFGKLGTKLALAAQFGLKAPMEDIKEYAKQAYEFQMKELEDAGYGNIPGLGRKVYDEMLVKAMEMGGRREEAGTFLEKRDTLSRKERLSSPEYTSSQQAIRSAIEESMLVPYVRYDRDGDMERATLPAENIAPVIEGLQKKQSELQNIELPVQESILNAIKKEPISPAQALDRFILDTTEKIADYGDIPSTDTGRLKEKQKLEGQLKFAESARSFYQKSGAQLTPQDLAGRTESQRMSLDVVNDILKNMMKEAELGPPTTTPTSPMLSPRPQLSFGPMAGGTNIMTAAQPIVPAMSSLTNSTTNTSQSVVNAGSEFSNISAQAGSVSTSFQSLSTNAAQAANAFRILSNTAPAAPTNTPAQAAPGAEQQAPAQQQFKLDLSGNLPEPRVEIGDVKIEVSSIDSIEGKLGQVESAINNGLAQLRQRVTGLETRIQALNLTVTRGV